MINPIRIVTKTREIGRSMELIGNFSNEINRIITEMETVKFQKKLKRN